GEKWGCNCGEIIVLVGFRCLPADPIPIIMLAIDYDVGYVAGCDAGPIERVATLRLAGGGKEDSNIVKTGVGERSCEDKRSSAGKKRRCEGKVYVTGAADQEIVTGIVLQRESLAEQAGNRAADCKNWRAHYLYSRNGGGGRPSTTGNAAGLSRAGWLSFDNYV